MNDANLSGTTYFLSALFTDKYYILIHQLILILNDSRSIAKKCSIDFALEDILPEKIQLHEKQTTADLNS